MRVAFSTILLAGGYGTRLYPMTKDRPKALLALGRQVILEPLLEALDEVPGREQTILVTNHRFFPQVSGWQQASGRAIDLIDNGTETNETRLGAIRDLRLALERIDPRLDALILGTDNLFSWSLREFVERAQAKRPSASVAVYDLGSLEDARQCGVAVLDPEGRIVQCVEKPAHPPSTLVLLCVYYLPSAVRPRVDEFLAGGGNGDAPGFFIEWLSKQEPVYGQRTAGLWFDIGTPEAYQQAVQSWLSQPTVRPSGLKSR